MQNLNHQFNAELAKNFALLLRKDLRENLVNTNTQAFEDWWLIRGRVDFPGWADELDAEQINLLFSSAGQATIAGLNIEVPKVVSLFAKYRTDAVKAYTKDGKLLTDQFFAWVVVQGLVEHKIVSFVPNEMKVMLDQPVPMALSSDDSNSAPALNLLMYLVWLVMDPEFKDVMRISSAVGRSNYMIWFFKVVKKLGLEPLIAGRWRFWLQTPVAVNSRGDEIPRFSQLEWLSSIELIKKFNPESIETVQKLRTWSDNAVSKSQDWSWLTKGASSIEQQIPAKKPYGVNLFGFAFGELGIGEDLRMAVEACEHANLPYHIVNISAGSELRQGDMHLDLLTNKETSEIPPPYAFNIFCLPGFDTVNRVFLQKGAAFFDGYYNIGWWPWELAVFPKKWQSLAFEVIDEVWASSHFLFKMYKNETQKPVIYMPLAASVARAKIHERKFFKLPENKCLYLFVFDFNSSVFRKNPFAVVETFQEAFPKDDNTVGLVLKVMNGNEKNKDWTRFLQLCDSDNRIILLTHTLDRPDVLGLINACDVYVSLHRSEGFGRTLAEAMLFGKPVIATGYSGNEDFMEKELTFPVEYTLVPVNEGQYQWVDEADGALWAEVDKDDAINKMIAVKKNIRNKTFKTRLQSYSSNQFSPERIGQMIQERLAQIF
jgi:glycosyltransferase involved in cell wall biosynthesis